MDGATEQITAVEEEAVRSYAERLMYRMHLTKGARFQAARRHKRRAIASTWAVTALSLYVFSSTSYLAVYDVAGAPNVEKPLILMSIVMSAFIIAFTVLEQGKKHDLKAELFLRCAQGVQELHDRLDFVHRTGAHVTGEIESTVRKYNELLNSFSENHSETDFRTFRINIGKHKGEISFSVWHAVKYWLDCWVILLCAVVVPPTVFAWVVYFSVLTPHKSG
ncbi:SLATT domain-containing protein [Octadecabacter sp. G9-8]|uniref:SLATT domain-containing protein n=1 Tax=Octadecabacter dasysiphoniae TaxID=2909341 RepID=A0ABS9CUE9_9RHOB|nr:SLATT domain-containing protein [Octadecabacter dasysiphoniae]MCF2870874.1 SLATT domain-containing protein [Octadecabacter dasysiphoniae]